MATQSVNLELPQEIVDLFASRDEVAQAAKQSLILDLLRGARISQGLAAELLGVTRWEILDLMVEHRIPSGPATPEELTEEVDRMREYHARRRLNTRD